MTPARFSRIQSVLHNRQPDLTVITDSVHKEHNLAAIIRNCDAVGIDRIHCVTPGGQKKHFMGTSASAEKWVPATLYEDVITPIKALQSQGFKVVAAHLSERATDYRGWDYTEPTAVLLGAELDGVSAEAMSACDAEVILPMRGMVESYNVSVACALILAEAHNQRERAGLYDTLRLDPSEFQRRCFEWAHPKLAEYCQRHDVPYPDLDHEGEVIDWPATQAKVQAQ